MGSSPSVSVPFHGAHGDLLEGGKLSGGEETNKSGAGGLLAGAEVDVDLGGSGVANHLGGGEVWVGDRKDSGVVGDADVAGGEGDSGVIPVPHSVAGGGVGGGIDEDLRKSDTAGKVEGVGGADGGAAHGVGDIGEDGRVAPVADGLSDLGDGDVDGDVLLDVGEQEAGRARVERVGLVASGAGGDRGDRRGGTGGRLDSRADLRGDRGGSRAGCGGGSPC